MEREIPGPVPAVEGIAARRPEYEGCTCAPQIGIDQLVAEAVAPGERSRGECVPVVRLPGAKEPVCGPRTHQQTELDRRAPRQQWTHNGFKPYTFDPAVCSEFSYCPD